MEEFTSMIWFAILVPISFILIFLAKTSPEVVEFLYSMEIYKFISQPLSRLTGIIGFSLGEMFFYIFVIWSIVKLFSLLRALLLSDKKFILKSFKQIISVLSLLLFLFVILWGLNYYRMPLSQTANLDKTSFSKQDLEKLCIYMIEEANTYRTNVKENPRGVMKLSRNKKHAISRAYLGYKKISDEYLMLKGDYGRPKIVLTSKFMSYAGIAGIFFPFTIEANVNGDVPDAVFPSNAAHEMAHQRGYAREDEANFISFLACIANPDIEYKYSGTLLALVHSINALYKIDHERAIELTGLYSSGLQRDLQDINDYWEKFEGPIERTSNKINNTYLKANNQKDGVESYGRMVDLLLAYYKLKIIH